MNATTVLQFVGVAALIGLNAFFVAVEFSVVASRRTRVEQLVVQGSGTAKIVLGWVESQEAKDKLIAAAQVGITIASLGLGGYGEHALAGWLLSTTIRWTPLVWLDKAERGILQVTPPTATQPASSRSVPTVSAP